MQRATVRTSKETIRTALQMAKDCTASSGLLEQAIACLDDLLDEKSGDTEDD